MKKIALIIVICLFAIQNCATTKHSTKAGVELSQYKSVFIGWLNLPLDDWEALEYNSEEDWEYAIRYINRHFQKYAKQVWQNEIGTPMSFAHSSEHGPSPENDLYIKFEEVDVVQAYYLYTSVRFIDLNSNNIIFEIPAEYYNGGRLRNFENRLITAGEYLIYDIMAEFK